MLTKLMIEIARLDHVSFAVQDVDASRRFFGEVLGLPEIDRPAFDFRGAWFGIGDRALHLIEQVSANRGAAAKMTRADHMALEVKDMDAVSQALDAAEIPYQLGTNDRLGFRQIFCADPDGHTIEFITRGHPGETLDTGCYTKNRRAPASPGATGASRARGAALGASR